MEIKAVAVWKNRKIQNMFLIILSFIVYYLRPCMLIDSVDAFDENLQYKYSWK